LKKQAEVAAKVWVARVSRMFTIQKELTLFRVGDLLYPRVFGMTLTVVNGWSALGSWCQCCEESANGLPVHQISRSEKQNCYGGGVRQMYVAGRLGLAEQLVS
jgi:hypothetical protein